MDWQKAFEEMDANLRGDGEGGGGKQKDGEKDGLAQSRKGAKGEEGKSRSVTTDLPAVATPQALQAGICRRVASIPCSLASPSGASSPCSPGNQALRSHKASCMTVRATDSPQPRQLTLASEPCSSVTL